VLKVGDLELDVLGRRAVRAAAAHRSPVPGIPVAGAADAPMPADRDTFDAARNAWPYDFEPRGNIIDMHITACVARWMRGSSPR